MLNINIDPEQINKYLSDKLLESGIGQMIDTLFKENLKKWLTGYDSPIEKIIKSVVSDAVKAEINKPANQVIVANAVASCLTKDVLKEIVSRGTERFMQDVRER